MTNPTDPSADGAANASGNRPAFGYTLKLNCFNYFFMFMFMCMIIMNTCTCFESLTIVMFYMLKYFIVYGIKIYRNRSNNLTA